MILRNLNFGIVISLLLQGVFAQDNLDLECYACLYNYHPTGNDDCVRDPEKLGATVWCDSTERKCFEQSQYDIGNGYIRSFSRGCEVITREDGCDTDIYYEECFYSCDTHLCNDNDRSIGPPPTTPPPPTADTTTKVRDLTCYSCQHSYHPDVEPTCVTDPDAVPPPNQVQCSSEERECFTFMQYDNFEDHVRSFTRGCEVLHDTEEGCVEDFYFTTCWTKCSTDFCNDGDGWPEKINRVVLGEAVSQSEENEVEISTDIPTTKELDLTCYSCQHAYHPDVNETCVTDPDGFEPTNQVQCNSDERECFTFMQYDNFGEHVRSFTRGCEVLNHYTERCEEDFYFTTCWTKCSTDFCNDGDGWPEENTAVNSGDNTGGAGNAATCPVSSVFVMITAIIVAA